MRIIFKYAIRINNSVKVNSPGVSVCIDANLFAIRSSFGGSNPMLSKNGRKIISNCSAFTDPVESVSASINFDVISSIPVSVRTGMMRYVMCGV